MVKIMVNAVRPNNIRPSEPMRLACDANCVSERSTGRAMLSGTKACRK